MNRVYIDGVSAVFFSSDETFLYSAGFKGDIKIWNLVAEAFELLHDFGFVHTSKLILAFLCISVNSIASYRCFIPSFLFVNNVVAYINYIPGRVRSIQETKDREFLLTASEDKHIAIIDLKKMEVVEKIAPLKGELCHKMPFDLPNSNTLRNDPISFE